MHPAYSVIFFTTASGAGYGLLGWLGALAAAGWLEPDRAFGLVAFALAFALVTGGLLASTAHLGHPERAWRGLVQWRSSWLAREGVVAVATYVPTGLFAIGWVFAGANGGAWAALGLAGAVLAAVTVGCTGMIYASLPTIPRWHSPWTVPVYLLFAVATGALLATLLARAFALPLAGLGWLAAVALVAAWAAKLAWWFATDRAGPVATAQSATGLGAIGPVRQLDPPHTGANFVMAEMGYRVARKHATRLRAIALVGGGLAPALLAAGAALAGPLAGTLLAAAAVMLAAAGVLVERWLFFAEARHVVTLYYGASAV